MNNDIQKGSLLSKKTRQLKPMVHLEKVFVAIIGGTYKIFRWDNIIYAM